MTTQDEVATEVNRRHVAKLAAAQDTASLIKWGWRLLCIGWIAPIIPVLGWFVFWICSPVAAILGIVAVVKGNTGGGLKLWLVGSLISVVIVLFWVSIYSFVLTRR